MAREDDALTNDALAALYRKYGFLLQRRCRTLLGDEAAAEDALQDAFVKFMRHGSELRAAENRLAWMYRVVDRCCFDQLRRRKHRRAAPIEDHVNEADPGPPPGTDVEARNAIIRVLDSLSEAEYEVAVLAYVDGLTRTEIADTLGLSRPTIWKRLTLIRERAMSILGERS